MTTQTILKNDGVFVYEDYKKGRSALRVAELTAQEYYQMIRRTNGGDVKAVLVQKDWYEGKIADFEALPAPAFGTVEEVITDDSLGVNLSTYIDMINWEPQVRSRINKTNAQGTTADAFKVYNIIKLKEFYPDNSIEVPFEDSVRVGGDTYAYLIHYAQFQHLSSTPVATTYAGTGDGTMEATLKPGGAVAETITVTATSATTFDVVGSVTGAMGSLTVGTTFESDQVTIDITAGSVAFIAGDVFTITSVAAAL